MPCLASGPARASSSSIRLQSNAVFEMMAKRPGPKTQNVLTDQTILLTGSLTDCPCPCVAWWCGTRRIKSRSCS
ncbi:hypothetical protein DFAR_2090020 [Desulfarculales bacterium]